MFPARKSSLSLPCPLGQTRFCSLQHLLRYSIPPCRSRQDCNCPIDTPLSCGWFKGIAKAGTATQSGYRYGFSLSNKVCPLAGSCRTMYSASQLRGHVVVYQIGVSVGSLSVTERRAHAKIGKRLGNELGYKSGGSNYAILCMPCRHQVACRFARASILFLPPTSLAGTRYTPMAAFFIRAGTRTESPESRPARFGEAETPPASPADTARPGG